MAQNFKNLRVYKEAFILSKNLYLFFDNRKVPFRAREQLLASASSICANLAEMGAFESKGQIIQKLTTCISEANETEFWLDMMQELNVLPKEKYSGFMEKLTMVRSMLFNLRKRINEIQK
ncbi:MAG: four helix bundle protein [Candidatus Micrarchaeia archaeon]|jgi:four helix bundle protein